MHLESLTRLRESSTYSTNAKCSKFAAEGTLKFQASSSKLQAGSILVALTVARVPHHRKPDHFKVPADLVLAAGADN